MARQSQTNEKALSTARRQISRAKRYREQEELDSRWDRLIDLYEGKVLGDRPMDDEIIVNHIFATINVIFPSISINNPKITVKPNKQADTDRAIITEAVINYWWDHYNVQPQFRSAAKDYLIVGHGWLKTCWKYEEEDQARPDSEIQSEIGQGMQQLQDAAAQNPDMAGDLPSPSDVQQGVDTKQTVVIDDCPVVERVSFRDMFVDPDATDMSNLRWIAQRLYRTVDEIRNDDRYPKGVRSGEIKTSAEGGPEAASTRPPTGTHTDDRSGFVTVWEFYDLVKRVMYSYADGIDGFLIKPKAFEYPFGHPYVMIRNYDVPDQFYPIGDVEMLESLQLELNKTRTQMVRHRNRGARKWLADAALIDAEARAAIESDDDMRVIKVKGLADAVDPRRVLVPVESQPVSADFYNTSQIIEADLTQISGVFDYERGVQSDIRRTATEASIMQDAANSRSADKLATIERCIGDVAANLIALAQQYLTGDQVARVVGADGAYVWVNFDAETLEGEYDFKIEGGSTQPNNESFRRQSALQLVEAMAQFGPVVNMHELALYVLETGFGVQNAQRFLAQGPPPGPLPQDKIIETINYKDLPPDVQRELEAKAGLQPSVLPPALAHDGSPAGPGGVAPPPPMPPPGGPPMPPPPAGGGPQPPPPDGSQPPSIPPEILQQLTGQVLQFSSAQMPPGGP